MTRTSDQSETDAPAQSLNDADVGFATRAIHHGYDPAGFSNAVQPPVFLNSSYGFESVAANEAAAALGGRLYAREYNPTTEILEKRLANPEGSQLQQTDAVYARARASHAGNACRFDPTNPNNPTPSMGLAPVADWAATWDVASRSLGPRGRARIPRGRAYRGARPRPGRGDTSAGRAAAARSTREPGPGQGPSP
jgi:hypothetical protein